MYLLPLNMEFLSQYFAVRYLKEHEFYKQERNQHGALHMETSLFLSLCDAVLLTLFFYKELIC